MPESNAYLSEHCLAQSSGVGGGQRLPCPAPQPSTLSPGSQVARREGWQTGRELSHASAPVGGGVYHFSALTAPPAPPPALAQEEAAYDSVCEESLGGCRGFLWF